MAAFGIFMTVKGEPFRKHGGNGGKANWRLNEMGWRVAVVWECAFRKHGQDSKEHIISELSLFFRSKDLLFLEIPPAANATPNLDSTEGKENSGEEKEPMAEIPK